MRSSEGNSDSGPSIELTEIDSVMSGGLWNITWRVKNTGSKVLQISSARLPHGQFKSEEKRFQPAISLEADEESSFRTTVRCSEPPGLVTENAFLILDTIWIGLSWRIFVRLRVKVNAKGKPGTQTESITTQKAGFSQEESPR